MSAWPQSISGKRHERSPVAVCRRRQRVLRRKPHPSRRELRSSRGRDRRHPRPQRRRQDDDVAYHPRHRAAANRTDQLSRGAYRGQASVRHRDARHRLGATGASHFPDAFGGGKSRTCGGKGAAGTVECPHDLRCVPTLARALRRPRQRAFRWRTTNAGDRARAHSKPGAVPHGRALGGLEFPPSSARSARSCKSSTAKAPPSFWSSKIWPSRSRSQIAS